MILKQIYTHADPDQAMHFDPKDKKRNGNPKHSFFNQNNPTGPKYQVWL